MQKLKGSICLFGAGKMGHAIGSALLERGVATRASLWGVARTEATAKKIRKALTIEVLTQDFEHRVKGSSIVILGVKPAQVREALNILTKSGLTKKSVVISIAAGVTLKTLQSELPPGTPIIRAVTNTPCTVQQGMTALSFGKNVTPAQRAIAHIIFENVGRCIEIKESQCEAMTALAASGPAFMYLMLEALADGGVQAGLSRVVAVEAAAQTMLGSALMVQKSGRDPESLRSDVTTPNGCTMVGIKVMEDNNIRSILARTIKETARRAKELGKI